MRLRLIVIGLISVAILAGLALVVLPQLLQQKQTSTAAVYWPTQGWRESTPEEQGFDSAKLAEGLQAIQDHNINVDSLLVIRDGSVFLDAYFYPYDGTTVHDLASATKSVMTTLIGIAAGQGKLELDQPIVSFFPNRTIANLDERKEKITVRHLTGMVNGLESGCQAGDGPTIAAMMAQPDWVQAALDRKMAQEPGTSFCYDSPGMHLLSAILQEATGITALEFARQNLFEPLGIQEAIWDSDPQGYTRGWGDLHLKPRDAAKIGYLFLHQGLWEGKQIVPAEWVEEATKSQTSTGGDDDYGYGWWIAEIRFGAQGRGGQRIFGVPSLDAIVVTTGSGFEYDEAGQYLTAAMVDTEKPLPPNPEGVVKLDQILAKLAQEPALKPAGPLPKIAQEISGKTYAFEPNTQGVETFRVEFNESNKAVVNITLFDSKQELIWEIGLDGAYRRMADGSARRGSWTDPQTFVFEAVDVETQTFTATFEGDRMVFESPGEGLRFEGKQESQ